MNLQQPADYLASSDREFRTKGQRQPRLPNTHLEKQMQFTISRIAFIAAAMLASSASFGADAVSSASVKPAQEPAVVLEGQKTMAAKGGDALPANVDAVTSASVVPQKYRQTDFKPNGFTETQGKKRAPFILDDPRHESVTYDLCVTAMKFFEEKGFEVELRDLIAQKFNPLITSREEFYHAKDGFGPTPKDVLVEQAYVKKADHIIFVQPNWQDSDPMFTKGYKLRVFSKGFSYDDGPKGRVGLLPGKTFYTIMNAGWLGMGQGQSGDSLNKNPQEWETWMFAMRVVDDDAAVGKDMKNLGRFVNDRTPGNLDPDYGTKIEALRNVLRSRLARDFNL